MNYKIGGCDVRFPHRAYGTQLSFMSKVIQALEGGQNALLEAPTGSGKTLSLLCASLAWQLREKQRIEEGLAQHRADMAAHIAYLEAQGAPTDDVPPQAGATTTNGGGGGIIISDPITGTTTTTTVKSDPDSQFQINLDPTSPSTGGAGVGGAGSGFLKQEQPDLKSPHQAAAGGFLPEGHPAAATACPEDPPHMNQKPPQIYYATRTHSQIAQVVAELKRSGYTPRMAVLGSKQHYCVNSHAKSQKGSIEQACDDLLKESQCQYFKGVAQMLNTTITRTVHDIEDLCKVGKRQKGCPYYVSRRIAEDAELVFAPYNYLVDPVICRSIGIKLESSIIIFDEAHNIEDVSREAASLDLERFTVMESLGALKRALQYNNKPQIYQPLCTMLETMFKWMDSKEQEAIAVGNANRNTNRNYNSSRFEQPYEKLWQAAPMMSELISLGLGPDQMESLWEIYQAAREEDESMAEKGGQSAAAGAPGAENKPAGTTAKAVRVGAGALGVISRLIQVVRLVHEESTDGGRDFRLVVKRESISNAGAGGGAGGDAGIRARLLLASSDAPSGSSLGPIPDHFLTFSLWCLNPAVAFRKLEAPAHSIILTSGTLSPMDSFASELGTNFPIKLEAPHVVNMAKQVWAGAIGTAPSGEKLLATYHYTDKTAFQDAVGNTVLQACRTIPDGLLLFLPSYGLLDKLCARWKVTGCYSRIDQIKPIVREPRTGGGDALQQVMAEYYAAIASGRGGLFMAVCRGKVSEGLDFADANARGVIVVGIPFPAFKDAKVEAKRKFNDAGQRTLGLLSGSVWYDQQAFRALNQAVGRCIRHRGDWGAIILMDERFQQAKYQKGLSRWLRGAIAPHTNSQAAFGSMEAFFTRIQADPPAAPVKLVADPPLGGGYGGEVDFGGGYKNEDEPKVNALAMLMAGHKAVTTRNALSRAVKKEEQRDVVDAAPPYQRQPTAAAATNHTNHNHTNNNNPNSLFNVVLRAPLRQIIPGEVAAWTAFAQNQGGAATEIDAQRLALEGMFEAFSLAKNAMNEPTPVHTWLHHAYVAPPWGLQAVLSLIPYQLPPGFAGQLHVDAVSFAGCSLSHASALEALHAMKDVYEEILMELYPGTFGAMMQERQQQREQRQPNFDYGGAGGDYGGTGFKRKWEEEQQQQHQYHQIQQPVNVNVHAAGGVGNAAAKQAKEFVQEQALLQSDSAIAGRAINSLVRENILMINHSALDPMEAHAMLLEERREWQIKQEIMRDQMRDQYHWQNNAEEYDLQLQRYYQQRWQHQQQCVRLNQILYGINHPMGDTHSHPAPPSAQPMAISPLPAPRNPLQVQNNNPSSSIFNNQKTKKRAVPHDDDGDSAWAMYNNNNINQRTAKRHHQ